MDAEIETIRKVDALTRSPNKGEAAAARSRLTALLKKRGKTLADLPNILTPPRPTPPTNGVHFDFAEMFARVDDEMERKEPGYKANRAAEKAKAEKDWVAYRKMVIREYGSADAAKVPNAMERAIEDAVEHLKREVMYKFSNGTFPTESLDGWVGFVGMRAPDHIAAVICAAKPMPTTITEAKAEFDAWEERDRELGAVWGSHDNYMSTAPYLSTPCSVRSDIVRDLLHTGLRAQTAAEALIRHKALASLGSQLSDKENAALLADLEHLAALEKAAVQAAPDQVANGHMKRVKRQPRPTWRNRPTSGSEVFAEVSAEVFAEVPRSSGARGASGASQ
jgi:hypothetical protein